MERKPHLFSVQQCRKFRSCCSLCIGTCSGPHWPRRSASRPSSTKLMGWTSWWLAFVPCFMDQRANRPRRTSEARQLFFHHIRNFPCDNRVTLSLHKVG